MKEKAVGGSGFGDEQIDFAFPTQTLDIKQPFSISEGRPFFLDTKRQELHYQGQRIPVKKDTAFALDGEIYVDSKTLSSWLPLDFEISRSELSVTITPREKLPLQEKMDREQRRLSLNSRGDDALKYPIRKMQYSLGTFPVVDFNMSGGEGKRIIHFLNSRHGTPFLELVIYST